MKSRTERVMSAQSSGAASRSNVGIPRHRTLGEEVWRLWHAEGRVQSCEIRDDSKELGGWDVLILENDEPLFSRWCANERQARYIAQSFKQDTLRTGWTESGTR